MDVTALQTMLAGQSPERFMRRHWHKKPLLVRQGFPGITSPVSRTQLFALAQQDEVESRLVVRHGESWTLRRGPLGRRALPALSQRGWTLLVQGLDLHVRAAHELMSRFRFVPDARLDDLMISYASDEGGVGPHMDAYDVFLIQVQGRRRWRVGRVKDDRLVQGVPLKLLQHFEPEQEWVLEPGDMLYLPPRWGHDGVAVGGDCMTCSVGFRSPSVLELGSQMLARLADALDEDSPSASVLRRYADRRQVATAAPARIPAELQAFAQESVRRLLQASGQLEACLGEWLTEPKPQVWFVPGNSLSCGQGVQLDLRTRMMYDTRHVFLNGESYLATGLDARLMRQLANARQLGTREVGLLSPQALALLGQWVDAGWVHATPALPSPGESAS